MIPAKIYIHIFYVCSYLINGLTVLRIAKKYRLKTLRHFSLKDHKKSDTLFILGSGKSIEEITEEQWTIIKNNDSLGFNFWLYHDFVPTFYVYEESLNVERNSLFYQLLNQKKDLYQDTPFIVKDIEYKGITVEKIPSKLKGNFYLSTELVIFGDKLDFKDFLNRGYQLIKRVNRRRKNVFLKRSGSLSYLLFLAESFGYKNIVLCGIDLKHSDYFFYHRKYKTYSIPHHNGIVTERHPTDVETNENIPISTVVSTINEQVFKRKGVHLFIGSKDSALFPMFRSYF
jgi:hypothetical protein